MTNLARTIRAFAILALTSGCAATSQNSPTPDQAAASGGAADPSGPRVELRLRRVAELSGTNGELRLREASVEVEYRAGERGAALDAGRVTLDGIELLREGDAARPRYRLRNDPLRDVPAAGATAATLAHAGSPQLPAGTARVEIAPWPRVSEPAPGQSAVKSGGLVIVLEPPPQGAWHRVTLDGSGGVVSARDLGLGRWELRAEDLASIAPGSARVVIEAQTSCAACAGAPGLAARWSTTSLLEIPITLF